MKTGAAVKFLIAVLASTLAVLIRALIEPIMGGNHAFFIPLVAVVFVSWHSGFWTGIVTLLSSVLAVVYFFIEPKNSLDIDSFADKLAVGLFLFAGVACAALGEAQLRNSRKAARSLFTARAKQRELEDLTHQFRSLAEAMPQIVWVTRPDGAVEYFNPKWYHFTGRSVDESLGVGWLDVLHPEDRAASEQNWLRATQTGEAYEVTYRFRGAGGDYRWFLGRGLPQRDDSGNILRWFGTCTDIDDAKRTADVLTDNEALLQQSHTELEGRVARRTVELSGAISALQDEVDFRRRAEERVVASAMELRRSNGELEQFAYVASHDLQEPLRKIQAFGDRLKTKCAAQLGADGQDYVERMLASATRMRQLINDLLAYSRLTSKPQAFTPVNLSTIAAGVISDLEIRIQQTGAQIEIGPLPTIAADPVQMRQLFQNLLSNALKFARPGIIPLVAIQSESSSGDRPLCRLQFRDNGIGFDVKYLDRIFQVFQRLHGRGDYEGTGVGLAICHKIVLLHGGDITAHSTPGEGATFVVTLPLSHPQAPIGTSDD